MNGLVGPASFVKMYVWMYVWTNSERSYTNISSCECGVDPFHIFTNIKEVMLNGQLES